MKSLHCLLVACAGMIGFVATTASAQTVITGNHNNMPDGAGYTISANGTYLIPANTGSTPSAEFNSNSTMGLNIANTTVTVTVDGGQFDGNEWAMNARGTVIVNGGEFSNNTKYGGINVISGSLTVNGGTFAGNLGGYGDIISQSGPVSVYGGIFTSTDNFNGTVPINIYGTFPGMTVGTTKTISGDPDFEGNWPTFTGTLENNSTPQTYSYVNTVVLHDVATPEPASAGVIGIAVFGVLLHRRKQTR